MSAIMGVAACLLCVVAAANAAAAGEWAWAGVTLAAALGVAWLEARS